MGVFLTDSLYICVLGTAADVAVSLTEDEINTMASIDTNTLQAFTARFLPFIFHLIYAPAKLPDSIRIRIGHPIQFDSNSVGRFENFRIESALIVVSLVKRLKPLMALCGTVYRLAKKKVKTSIYVARFMHQAPLTSLKLACQTAI